VKVLCYNIKWDTDGKKVKLASEVEVEVADGLTEEELEDVLPGALSDATGWCHKGFEWKIKNKGVSE
jgi:hypothetical protein